MKLWRKPFDHTEISAKPAKVVINKDRCKGCGYCVEFCPKGALVMSQEMNAKGYLLPKMEDPSKCLGCGFCEAICPDFGICVISSDGKE
jgi:2-oxoglutarate ferredoxin oxidoreductase subunit delta